MPPTDTAGLAEERRRVALAVAPHLLRPQGSPASFDDLAQAAGVAPARLAELFPDRDALVEATFAAVRNQGQEHTEAPFDPDAQPVETALRLHCLGLVAGFREDVLGAIVTGGLSAGLGHPRLGPAFLEGLLEPVQQTTERLIAVYQERGRLAPGEPRVAALALLGPLLIALLHQDSLGGSACRPLELGAFVDAHLRAFLQGWAPPPAAAGAGSPPGPPARLPHR